jgi:alanine dehydrogenase
MIRLGLVRETKTPPDRRVPLSPAQCRRLLDTHHGLDILVQPSPIRCFADEEYAERGIELAEDLSGCDALFGVKEVSLDALLPDRTRFFFSHTAESSRRTTAACCRRRSGGGSA